jgi:hypothetical protein
MRFAAFFLLSLAPLGQAGSREYFEPQHRVSGIGAARDDLSNDVVEARAAFLIESQTFGIMREAMAVGGAKRITTDSKLQPLFRLAAARSGLPASLLEAIAYLESWGDARAASPAGPRGIMQISAATARDMKLRVVEATRYKVTRVRVPMKSASGKIRYKTVNHKTPYVVTVRDDRLFPERAIPAAALYLAGLERKFGGRDWAIFAYHCGAGCVSEMLDLTRRARGIPQNQVTVARMFFSCSPAWNRELYLAIQQQMQRDYSPTYYFRIMRAEQLLALYRTDPDAFGALHEAYKSEFSTAFRAPHRLSVWLKHDDMAFQTAQDIRDDGGKRLAKVFDQPAWFGFRPRIAPGVPEDLEYLSQASPSAIGALAYIAFETRRLFQEMHANAETFQPLPVTALVEPQNFAGLPSEREGLAHASGQVFDIDYSGLPPVELECLRFVLDDLGWEGYLGFVEEGRDNLHIGCSPASRDFFISVFQEALSARSTE